MLAFETSPRRSVASGRRRLASPCERGRDGGHFVFGFLAQILLRLIDLPISLWETLDTNEAKSSTGSPLKLMITSSFWRPAFAAGEASRTSLMMIPLVPSSNPMLKFRACQIG